MHTINNTTPSQIASWYHSQILRIPHGNQNPTKRYLTDDKLLSLFDGAVIIEDPPPMVIEWDDWDDNSQYNLHQKHTPK